MTTTAVEKPTDLGPTPPNDIPAEQAVLGAMMLSANAVAEILDLVDGGDFYRPIHGTIFDAIVHQYSRGMPTDPIAVAAHLADTGDLARIGGAPYMHTLIAAVPTAANGSYYARQVAEHASDRRLVETGMKITTLGFSGIRDPANPKIDQAAGLLDQAITVRHRTELVTAGDALQDVLKKIEQAADHPGLLGMSTGFIDLDRYTHGLQAGHMWVIAGRPGMGKSVLGCADIVRSVAIDQKIPTLVFSLEMGKEEILRRLLSAEANIPHEKLLTGKLTDQDWSDLARASARIDEADLYIDDSGIVTLTGMRTAARRLSMKLAAKGKTLGLIIVDYLQLMSGSGSRKEENRQQEVANISRGLKLLARELLVAMLTISQLNRGPEGRASKRPQLSDLRESGAVEQDVDVAILLHRDDYYDKECARAGECDFIVAKCRHGETGDITVAAQLHVMRFADMSRDAIR